MQLKLRQLQVFTCDQCTQPYDAAYTAEAFDPLLCPACDNAKRIRLAAKHCGIEDPDTLTDAQTEAIIQKYTHYLTDPKGGPTHG